MATFNARMFALGWLSVAMASSSDKDAPPVLLNTVALETFREGVRLVATDGFMLAWSFVPDVEHGPHEEPLLDEPPDRTIVAIDRYGRARGLMGHLLKLTTYEAAASTEEVRFNPLGAAGRKGRQDTLDGMEVRSVTLDHPDHERVQLDVFDGEYPAWRKIVVGGFVATMTDAVAFNPAIIDRLGKMGKLHGCPIVWRFGGENRAALVELPHSEPHLDALVMPVRWDMTRNVPATTPDPEAPSEGGDA